MRNFKKNNRNKLTNQFGVTLIELLVAMGLGVVVIIGVSQGLISMYKSSRLQEQNAELQDNADSALSYISFRLKNSLSTPCERINILEKTKRIRINDIPNSSHKKEITSLISNLGISVKTININHSVGNVSSPKSDEITIMSAPDRFFINDDVTFKTSKIKIDGLFPHAKLGSSSLYAITNCKRMDVFYATRSESKNKTTLNLNPIKGLPRYAKGHAMISPLDITQFLINNKNGLVNKNLFKKSPGSLIDGIELMRIIFSIDKNGDGVVDEYLTAGQLSNLIEKVLPLKSSIDRSKYSVLSANVYIMLRADEPDSSVPKSYKIEIPDTSGPISSPNFMQVFTITDQIQRKVFMRSIAFRNNMAIL